MKLIQLFEKIRLAPRHLISFVQNRMKDMQTAEQALQDIERLLSNRTDELDDILATANRELYDVGADFDTVDRAERVIRSTSLDGMKTNLESLQTYFDDLDHPMIKDYINKSLEYYVSSAMEYGAEGLQRIEALASGLDAARAAIEEYGYSEAEDYNEALQQYAQLESSVRTLAKAVGKLKDAAERFQAGADARSNAATAQYSGDKYKPPGMEDTETLWHATVHADDIGTNGFQATKPSNRQGVGMYGDQTGISFTYDRKIANDIMRALRELAMIVNGQVTTRQILGWIQSEGISMEDVQRMMEGVPFDESVKSKIKLYNIYLWFTQIRTNPVFANIDELATKLQGVDPREIGIVQAEVDMNQIQDSKPAEREMVVPPSAVKSVKRVI